MSFEEAINRHKILPDLPVMPELTKVSAAKRRVMDKWSDIIPEVQDDDHEKILSHLYNLIQKNNWHDVKLSFVLKAFRVAFLDKFKDDHKANTIVNFALEELESTSNATLVNSMASIYVATFNPNNRSTQMLADRLSKRTHGLLSKWQKLLETFEAFFSPKHLPEKIASKMLFSHQPFFQVKKYGFSDPHAYGLMDFVHLAYLDAFAPQLETKEGFESLLNWINPEPKKIKLRGQTSIIEAVLKPWINKTPDENFRQYITEKLITVYDDPRIRRDNWLGVSDLYMNVIFSWLTKEDLRFFTSVVTATQKNPMWGPRRDFWLDLYKRGKIEQAWVAFCPSAARYARQELSASGTTLDLNRFGRQTNKKSRANTSILIMKIQNKIFVDGCHDYSTHVWNIDDPAAPRLFKSNYDCDEDIRLKSPVGRGKAHNSIPSWKLWVEKKIYETIPMSTARPINWDAPNRNFNFQKPVSNTYVASTSGSENTEKTKRNLSNRREPNSISANNAGLRGSVAERETKFTKQTFAAESASNKKVTFDLDKAAFKNELSRLSTFLNENNENSFELALVLSAGMSDKPLSKTELEKLNMLFSRGIVHEQDYPQITRAFQPIFKIDNAEPNYEKWSRVIKAIEFHGNRLRILSRKSESAIAKLALRQFPLNKEEINSFEYLLQTLRARSISIDNLFN